MRFAAIDIGTVTCRLLIADVVDENLVELERRVAITNLGIGVDSTKTLREDAIDRVVNQIAEYKQCIDTYRDENNKVIPTMAVATSAARDASNSQVLIERLANLGVELSVIEGSREAALTFKGASAAFAGQNIMVLDIGGGSTEVICGVGGGTPQYSYSFNIGCRRVTERFFVSDPPTVEQCCAARSWQHETMKSIFENIRSKNIPVDRIIAVAGTATSTVSIDKHMEVYDPAQVDGTVISKDTLQSIYDHLRSMPLVQREAVVGLEPKRASVIVAGLGILLTVLDLCGINEYTVSEADILQGIIAELAQG